MRPGLFVAGACLATGADLHPDTDLMILQGLAGVALIIAALWGAIHEDTESL